MIVRVLAFALIVGVAVATRDLRNDEDLLPGWLGTDNEPDLVRPDTMAARMSNMKVLDAEARIFLFEHFLTDEECDHIVALAEKHMERSGVVDTQRDGASVVSDIRTSSGMFLNRGQDEVVRRVEEKIAAWTLLPVGNGEGMQVLRYHKEQKYDAHWDYFFHKDGIANGGNRYATVLTYLADTEEGGETVFPNIPAPGGRNDDSFSECARHHLAAKPRKGTAVLFHSIKPTGELERKSLHTACPVIKGIKWSAAKWLHVGHYAMGGERAVALEQKVQAIPKAPTPDGCDDMDDLCEEWVQAGECERNPVYMVGSRARPGHCVKSCNRCDIMAESGAENQQNQKKFTRSDNAGSKARRSRGQ